MWLATIILFTCMREWGFVLSEAVTLLKIGAMDINNSMDKGLSHRTQIFNYTTTWGDDLKISVLWSFGTLEDKFSQLKQVKGLLDMHVDYIVMNDVFYGTFQSKHHLNFPTPVIHYQGNLSPFVKKSLTWPTTQLPFICAQSRQPVPVHGEDTNDCMETDVPRNKSLPLIASKVDVLVSILKTLKWKNVILLFDIETELEAQTLLGTYSRDGARVVMYNVGEHTNHSGIHALLSENYKNRDPKEKIDYILLCSKSCVNNVISVANMFDKKNGKTSALSIFSRWLIVFPHESHGVIERCALELDNVALIDYPPVATQKTYRMSEGLPRIVKEILRRLGTQNATDTYSLEKLRSNASELLTTLLDSHSHCWRCDIQTLLWKPNGRRELGFIGYVNRTGHLNAIDDIFPNVKFGLNKRNFRVSTNVWSPFVKRKTGNSSLPYEGYCIDLLIELGRGLNFSYNLTEPEDGHWGDLINDTWTGLIRQLELKEVDLVVAPLSIQPKRELVVDFIFPFFHEYTTVLIKKPDPNKTKWKTLIEPFKWPVLLCIGISLVFATTLLCIFERWNPFYSRQRYMERTDGSHVYGDAFWYMYGALLTQGGEHLPDSQAGRTVVSSWWLFSIVMAATYSGNLIAFLTVAKDKLPFETLDGMISQSDYQWGTVAGTSWITLFKTSNISEYKAIWEGIQRFSRTNPRVLSKTPEDHRELVKKGGYAYIGDRSMMEIWLAEECDLQFIKEHFSPLQYAIALPNNSAYTNIFSDEMLRIYESGLLQIWKSNWWPKRSFCKGSLITEAKPIKIIDVQSAFYLIGIGIFIAAIALSVEWFLRLKCKRHPDIQLTSHIPYLTDEPKLNSDITCVNTECNQKDQS